VDKEMKRREFIEGALLGASAMATPVGIATAFAGDLNIRAKCARQLSGRVVFPRSSDYASARVEFNTALQRFPLAIVFAANTEDVANAICFARDHRLPIRLRSGRHSYEALSAADGSIVIDVSQMKGLDLDPNTGIATVQTGVRDFELAQALWGMGRMLPGGLCFTTGIAGFTQGGGQTSAPRTFGLIIDSLVSAEMVNANGDVIYADMNQNPDLFWALRGAGGGNFGACTTFRFQTYPVEPNVAYAQLSWPISSLKPVFRNWQQLTAPGFDTRLNPFLLVLNDGKSQNVQVNVIFFGAAAELRQLLDPLLRAARPQQVDIFDTDWITAVETIGATQPNAPVNFKSAAPFVQELPDAAIDVIQHFVMAPPAAGVQVSAFFHGLNGEVAQVAPRDTAYFWRDAWSNLSFWAQWTTGASAYAARAWVEGLRRAVYPYTSGTYVNAPDLTLENWQELYWGKNFLRLTEVKSRYDPGNLFNFPQSIPLVESRPRKFGQ
jgi:FAD/FMN-containing dehydrogenase